MKTITVVTPCYNEEDNVEELLPAGARRAYQASLASAIYHLFIDNRLHGLHTARHPSSPSPLRTVGDR